MICQTGPDMIEDAKSNFHMHSRTQIAAWHPAAQCSTSLKAITGSPMSRYLHPLLVIGALFPVHAALAQKAVLAPAAVPEVIHAFVALCDNASQGIQPVPPKTGNGDDPDENLHWGCDDGLPVVCGRSREWQKLPVPATGPDPDGEGPILRRIVFRHRSTGAFLVGDAYRGREIKTCLTDYFAALAGHHPVTVKVGKQRSPQAEPPSSSPISGMMA
jgi:hypothetical protein